jgi:hypothetical protein
MVESLGALNSVLGATLAALRAMLNAPGAMIAVLRASLGALHALLEAISPLFQLDRSAD